jgi:hypothetical protein
VKNISVGRELSGFVFENQTECKTLQSTMTAYESLSGEVSEFFNPTPFIEGRVSDDDFTLANDFAGRFLPAISSLIWQGSYPSQITDDRGHRLPNTFDQHPGLTLDPQKLSQVTSLVLLVAVQAPYAISEIPRTGVRNPDLRAKQINETIGKACLSTELILGLLNTATLKNLSKLQSKPKHHDYVPIGMLTERATANRPSIQKQASRYALAFCQEVRNEYIESVLGSQMLDSYPSPAVRRSGVRPDDELLQNAYINYIDRQPFLSNWHQQAHRPLF